MNRQQAQFERLMDKLGRAMLEGDDDAIIAICKQLDRNRVARRLPKPTLDDWIRLLHEMPFTNQERDQLLKDAFGLSKQ
jgi:hypothetical protein